MRRLSFDVILVATLLAAPLVGAQQLDPVGGTPTHPSAGSTQYPAPDSTGAPSTTYPYPAPSGAEVPGDTTLPSGESYPSSTQAPRTQAPSSTSDLDLVNNLHQANLKDQEMCQTALDRLQSARVKAFARKVLADHKAADKQLMSYATRKNIDKSQLEATATEGTLPSDSARSSGHDHLNTASGTEYDRAFVTMMIDEHDKAIQMVRDGRDSVSDKQLKSMLTALLPKLERHRQMAQTLLDKHLKS